MMKIYRFEMVLAFALLCLCSWTSVLAQQSGSAASVSKSSNFDVKRKANVEEVQELRLVPAESDSCELLADVEVRKNYTIAELANSLFQMARLARSGNYAQAQSVLDASISSAYRRYPNMEDEDLRFIINIVEGYRRDLRVYNKYSRKNDCGSCRPNN
jgi:hypothetical protein